MSNIKETNAALNSFVK